MPLSRFVWSGSALLAAIACGGPGNDDLLSRGQGGQSASSTGGASGASSATGGAAPGSSGNGAGGEPSAGGDTDVSEGGTVATGGSSAGGESGAGGTAGAAAAGGTAGAGGKASPGGTAGAGGKASAGAGAGGVAGAGGKASGGAGGKSNGGAAGALSGGAGGASAGSANAGAAGAPTCSGKCDANAECRVSGSVAACTCNAGFVGNGRTCALPISCGELHEASPNLASGAYTLKPAGAAEFSAYCEMAAEGGGWTLVLNDGPSFTPSGQGTDVQCFRQNCTSLAYSTVPIVADVMLDVRDGPIVGTNQVARVIVTGVAAATRNKTVRALFLNGPHYLEQEDNSNLAVRLSGTASCTDSLPTDFATLVCPSCAAGATCSAPVLTFGDTKPGCVDNPNYAFAIGGSESYTTAWDNCAGWPQTPNIGDFNYYPDNFRVWVR